MGGAGPLCANDDFYCIAVCGADVGPHGGGVYQWQWESKLEVDVLGDYDLGWVDASIIVLFRSRDLPPRTTAEPGEEAPGRRRRGSKVVGEAGEDGSECDRDDCKELCEAVVVVGMGANGTAVVHFYSVVVGDIVFVFPGIPVGV